MDSKRTNRRELLKGGAALAGGVTLGELAASQAQAHDHPMTPGSENASPMILGSKELVEYGQRSRYVTSVRIQHPPGGRPSPDLFGKVFHVASPLQDSVGVITPSSLHYVATTRGSYMPDIDPKQHTLTIHGLVDQPLTLTMDDLKRFPSVTRLHFIECAGNRHTPQQKTVQETHGMTSCAEWTGVPLSTLLKECGLKGSATWFVAEGAEEVKGASSIATSACQQASAASAAVSARRMRGPSPTAITSFMRRRLESSAASNPPSGPITIAHGADARRVIEAGQGLGDGRAAAGLVAHQQATARGPVAQQPAELHRCAHLGHAQPLGLLGRLDGIGAQALDIDPLDDGVVRDDRLQHGDAELGRLLRHIVDARALQGREAEPDVGLGRPARACARR